MIFEKVIESRIIVVLSRQPFFVLVATSADMLTFPLQKIQGVTVIFFHRIYPFEVFKRTSFPHRAQDIALHDGHDKRRWSSSAMNPNEH